MNNPQILIKNIYYMLSYAFSILKESNIEKVSGEDFDNIHNLFAAILSNGIGEQLKRGLHREYILNHDNLSAVRGKIDIQPFNNIERHYLDVTIDNTLFKRYVGELCILLQDLPRDERVNVIGKLKTTPFLLNVVKENKPFKIIPID